MRRVCLLLALSVLVVACSTDPQGTRLALQTAEARGGECDAAAAAPFRIDRAGNDVVFVDVASGERRAIVWPLGFAAWLEFDVAVVYASDGTVVGREGDILDNIGGSDIDSEGFRVCAVGVRTYR